jgi:hypothetical protein
VLFPSCFSCDHIQYQAISNRSKFRGCKQAWTPAWTPTQQNCSSLEPRRCTDGRFMRTEVAAWGDIYVRIAVSSFSRMCSLRTQWIVSLGVDLASVYPIVVVLSLLCEVWWASEVFGRIPCDITLVRVQQYWNLQARYLYLSYIYPVLEQQWQLIIMWGMIRVWCPFFGLITLFACL